MSDKLVRIKNRYDSAENWNSDNPVLAKGEIGIDSTNNIIKVGNGSSKWMGTVGYGNGSIGFVTIDNNTPVALFYDNNDGTHSIVFNGLVQLPELSYVNRSTDDSNPEWVKTLAMMFIDGYLPCISTGSYVDNNFEFALIPLIDSNYNNDKIILAAQYMPPQPGIQYITIPDNYIDDLIEQNSDETYALKRPITIIFMSK